MEEADGDDSDDGDKYVARGVEEEERSAADDDDDDEANAQCDPPR